MNKPLIIYHLCTEESAVEGDVEERGTVCLQGFARPSLEVMPDNLGPNLALYLGQHTNDPVDTIRWMLSIGPWRDDGFGLYTAEYEDRSADPRGTVVYFVGFGRPRTRLLELAGVAITK